MRPQVKLPTVRVLPIFIKSNDASNTKLTAAYVGQDVQIAVSTTISSDAPSCWKLHSMSATLTQTPSPAAIMSVDAVAAIGSSSAITFNTESNKVTASVTGTWKCGAVALTAVSAAVGTNIKVGLKLSWSCSTRYIALTWSLMSCSANVCCIFNPSQVVMPLFTVVPTFVKPGGAALDTSASVYVTQKLALQATSAFAPDSQTSQDKPSCWTLKRFNVISTDIDSLDLPLNTATSTVDNDALSGEITFTTDGAKVASVTATWECEIGGSIISSTSRPMPADVRVRASIF